MFMDICTYNIRGLNNKQSFVKDFISLHRLSFISLLETKVKEPSAQSVSRFINHHFTWLFNYDHHCNGRIWVGFDPTIWSVTVLTSSAQHLTCSVKNINASMTFSMSFVYAFNSSVERRSLWRDLINFNNQLPINSPWSVCGDLNVCLSPAETSYGLHWNNSMSEFRDFISHSGLSDLRSVGPVFTWWDCNISDPKYKKLDRCLVNGDWISSFTYSQATTLPRGLSDHCPIGLHLGLQIDKVRKPFQFFNHLINHEHFLDTIKAAWDTNVHGDPWYILTSKLKRVKTSLISLNTQNGNVHNSVLAARTALLNFQENMPVQPSMDQFLSEKHLVELYNKALNDEEQFLKQKSRIHSLKCGDSNNNFFFKRCKSRWNHNKILQLNDASGNTCTGHNAVSRIAVDYYSKLLGTSHSVNSLPEDISLPSITAAQALDLQVPFSNDDIFKTLKTMAKNKCPGPDGFTVEFYLASWSIVGDDVCNAILYFFNTLHLPRIINSTALALVPKSQSPSSMADFRPIACCNTLYKCITKMIASKLKRIMPSLISNPQSAFIPGRKIGDNILLCQALLRDYHVQTGPQRCAFKIDLRKAFDSLNWDFLRTVLTKMGFPGPFINLLMTCVEGSMLSIKLNGAIEGFFAAKSGLRQGDPLSPYLFVIAMEVLTACLKKHTASPSFKHHWCAKDLDISHVMFADDVFLFCHGDNTSVDKLMMGLQDFSLCSGLIPNNLKSSFYSSNISQDTHDYIRDSTGFTEGTLPVKYLGLPLISSKLSYRLCLPLVMRICNKIDGWTNKCLSQAGRLQLLKAVLYGILNYWSVHFMLPKAVLKKLQSIFTHFLWGGSSSNSKLVKVAWSDCCTPKSEGGLGLCDLNSWNTAACLYQLWRITQSASNSLWILWFNRIFLKRRAFWTMHIPNKASWCIRKILQLRPLALRHICYAIGTDSNFLFWQDPWVAGTTILSRIHTDVVSLTNSNLLAKAHEFMYESSWQLPTSNHLDIVELRRLI